MHSSYAVSYPIKPDCDWHTPPPPVEAVGDFSSATPMRIVAEWTRQRLGGLDAIDFGREIVRELKCAPCGWSEEVFKQAENIPEDKALCKRCGAECAPVFLHSIDAESELLTKTVAELGLPAWDIVWARHGEDSIGIQFEGDNPMGEQ
jgi:hypothetical protein